MKNSIVIIIFLLSSTVMAGGGWTPAKGEGFFMLSQRFISGKYYFSGTGTVVASPNFSALTTNIYGEYGLSKKLAAVLYSPFLTHVQQDAGIDELGNTFVADKALGFGDIDLGLKYNFYDKKMVVSASFYLGIPSGNYKAGNSGQLHLGDGDFSQLLRFDASKAFGKNYFSLYGGFNNRNNGFSDDVQFGAEIGRRMKSLVLMLKLDARFSTYNGSKAETISFGIYSNNLHYVGVTPQLLYEFKNNFGLSAEAGFAASGKNIIAAPSFTIGIFYNLKK